MKTKIQKARETLKNIKKLKANHLDDFFRYILKKYYSQPMTIKHISDSFVKCLKITYGEELSFWQLECCHNAVFESTIVQLI